LWAVLVELTHELILVPTVTINRTVGAGEKVEPAFRRILGTSERSFVARWRADLRRLAGGLAG